MFRFIKKLFMDRIESIEKLIELAQRMKKTGANYKAFSSGRDYIFEIYNKDSNKVYEFICDRKLGLNFIDEALEF